MLEIPMQVNVAWLAIALLIGVILGFVAGAESSSEDELHKNNKDKT